MQNAPLAHKWCVTSWHGRLTTVMRQRARQRPHCWGKWGRSLLYRAVGCASHFAVKELVLGGGRAVSVSLLADRSVLSAPLSAA